MIATRLASTPADRARALEVWKAARAAQGRRPNNDVVARVEQKAESGLLLLAEEGDDLVGLALAEAGADEQLMRLEMVIVHPGHQGRGLGAALVEAVADTGWERGFRRAEVWCTAPGFYEAAGFERSGQVKESGSVHLVAELEAPVRDVAAAGEIRLGQFLKLAELVESGSEAKALISEGLVLVNDDVETRRGRQLVAGDVVRANDRAARLVTAG